MPATDHLNWEQHGKRIIRELPNVERGPMSHPDFETGLPDVDVRMNVSVNYDAAVNALQRQKLIGQLGEVEWLGHESLHTVSGGPREQSMVLKSGGAPEHLYRGMGEAEFQEAKGRGFIQSDQRGVISEGWEGTNAATDPASAHVYMPRKGTGRIVKIAHHPEDEWFVSPIDQYARTRGQIPWERVVAHTEEFAHPDSDVAPPTMRERVTGKRRGE